MGTKVGRSVSSCECIVEAGSAGDASDTVVEVVAEVGPRPVDVPSSSPSEGLSAVPKSEVLPHPAAVLSSPHPVSPTPEDVLPHPAAVFSSPHPLSPPPEDLEAIADFDISCHLNVTMVRPRPSPPALKVDPRFCVPK